MNNCLGFLGVNFGMYAIRKVFGRRSILILGAIASGLCHLSSAIAATVDPNTLSTGNMLVKFIGLFMSFYNASTGAALYPVATELVSSRLRAWTVGTATSLGYFLSWLMNFCMPYFINPEHLNWVGCLFFSRWMMILICFANIVFRARNMSIYGLGRISYLRFSFTCLCRRWRVVLWRT